MSDKQIVEIHPTAMISSDAVIGEGVRIGPYTVIGSQVKIGEGTEIGPHTVIEGPTCIGKDNSIIGQAAIGTAPQDLKYQGEESFLSIGDGNIIREFVTINRGTEGGGRKTTIGNHNALMTGVHIAHDCHVGMGTILTNSATLAGHVEVEDYAIVGAFSGVHQFCRVGTHAFIGGYSVLTRDALPFIKTVGYRNRAAIYGINSLGLKRKEFSSESIKNLKRAYQWLFQKGLKVSDAVDKIEEEANLSNEVRTLLRFIETAERGFVRDIGEGGGGYSEVRSDRR